jgi:opacity protein-like surface antigen
LRRYGVRTMALALAAGLTFASSPAKAEPRHASVGFFTEAGGGPAFFLQDAGSYSAMGPAIDIRAGYDLFSWLSVGGYLGASIHEATVPPPPVGEYYQLYHAGADLRLGYLFGRIGVFVDGRVGGSMISSNILEKVAILEPGQRFSLSFAAGAGVEYQLENRHYAFGLGGQWMTMPGFDGTQGVTTRLYLRYTY